MYCPPELEDVEYVEFPRTLAPQLARAGTWAEFGVWGGNSARHFINLLPDDTELHLFDSFKGLPEDWMFNDELNPVGRFGMQDHEIPVFNDIRVHVHKGMFADTLPKADMGVLDFVHVDCDIYSSARTVFEFIEVSRGTIILFDEYHGYEDYRNHERKAYMEWSEKTGNSLEWIAKSRTQALGRVT